MLKNLVYIAVFTLFVSSLWVGLSIYHNFSSTTISKDLDIQIVPIADSFDMSAVNILKKKQLIEVNLAQTVSSPSAKITPSPAANIITPSPQAKLTPALTATPSISPTPTTSQVAPIVPGSF